MAANFSTSRLPSTLVTTRKSGIASTERFSLLLLEFGEVYLEDFGVIYYPAAPTEAETIERKQRGRLKLCSRSLLFDPLDFSYPIVKVALKDCHKEIVKCRSKTHSKVFDNTFTVVTRQVTEMLEGNVIAAHRFIREDRMLLFSLTYGEIDSVLPQIQKVQRSLKLPTADHNKLIDSIIQTRHSEISFNTSWLENFYEETILETFGEHITPLVSNRGRIMLTSSRIYFQAANNAEMEPVIKLQLSSLIHVMKRRYLLRHVGMELFSRSGQTLFLVLPSTGERNRLYERLVGLPVVQLEQVTLEEMTQRWQSRQISNYDYLMYLNFMADRSFIDIMQYPVMPWIIADYTSDKLDLSDPKTFRDLTKPIGALNEERLAFFKERCEGMSGRKFLYGTHYSAPGYVLYFLVRSAPEYLLCLQNGRFDQPNRLFHSIARTWDNVLTDHADVKELIPEFYQPPGDFLLNMLNLDLGVRTDGIRVEDVVVPPWAKDAEDFTRQCRDALESDYVSENIHHWIDLIFGYKQKGPDAQKANNLFHYLTYEGTTNYDIVNDPAMQAAVELQIKEFGQTPKQLFLRPHPIRRKAKLSQPACNPPCEVTAGNMSDCDVVEESEPDAGWVMVDGSEATDNPGKRMLKFIQLRKAHKEALMDIKLSHDKKAVFSVSHDKTLKVHQLDGLQMLRSASVSNLPISSISVLPDSKTVIIGSWDNNIYLYSVEFGSVVSSSLVHDSSVTCVCWRKNTLATGSWDSTVKVWSLPFSPSWHKPPTLEQIAELDHDNEVTCLDMDPSVIHLASGVADGFVTLWNIEYQAKEFELKVHSAAVFAIVFSDDGNTLCTCSADSTIKLLGVKHRAELVVFKSVEPLHCVAWCGEHLLCGGESGDLHQLDADTLTPINRVKGHSDSVTSIDISADFKVVVTGGKDKCIGVWSFWS